MTLIQIRNRLRNLGYDLSVHEKDALGKRHLYRTTPAHSMGGGGATCYFDDKERLIRYVKQAEQIRSWQGV